MAGNRKFNTLSKMWNIVRFLVFCELSVCVFSIQCKSQQNEPVDWFIAYKLPKSTNNVPVNSFFYMDVKSKSWSLSDKTLNNAGQAISNTLEPIYKTSKNNGTGASEDEIMYLMYNDELPDKINSRKKPEFYSLEHGHTKGVIGFDKQSGFWLIHSTPKFPPVKGQGYSYPESADIYAQSFLCISMATDKNANELGTQLLYNYPDIYDKSFQEYFQQTFPKMADAVNGNHVTTEPWYRKTSLSTLSGTEFVSYAKIAYFNEDIFSDWLAPEFGNDLLVETWQNGRNKLCSNCTGKYQVYNIEEIQFQSESITFTETKDHSKWTVTNTTSSIWTCIGDINRQLSQLKRSGGMVCFQDKSVWSNFHQLISSYHDCHPYSGCVNSTMKWTDGVL